MENRRRKPTRLKGFDYSQPAEYFVTICTKNRACILGEVVDGLMSLSECGKIVEAAWNDIPGHFRDVHTGMFKVMPNHVHGIIEILENPIRPRIPCGGGVIPRPFPLGASPPISCRGGVIPPLDIGGDETSPLHRITLGNIVAYFKYESTKFINELSGSPGTKVFQRNYHDRIIRSDIERFYIERYIELNPLVWFFDADNPGAHSTPIVDLERVLNQIPGLDEHAARYILDREADYRVWRETINADED